MAQIESEINKNNSKIWGALQKLDDNREPNLPQHQPTINATASRVTSAVLMKQNVGRSYVHDVINKAVTKVNKSVTSHIGSTTRTLKKLSDRAISKINNATRENTETVKKTTEKALIKISGTAQAVPAQDQPESVASKKISKQPLEPVDNLGDTTFDIARHQVQRDALSDSRHHSNNEKRINPNRNIRPQHNPDARPSQRGDNNLQCGHDVLSEVQNKALLATVSAGDARVQIQCETEKQDNREQH